MLTYNCLVHLFPVQESIYAKLEMERTASEYNERKCHGTLSNSDMNGIYYQVCSHSSCICICGVDSTLFEICRCHDCLLSRQSGKGSWSGRRLWSDSNFVHFLYCLHAFLWRMRKLLCNEDKTKHQPI